MGRARVALIEGAAFGACVVAVLVFLACAINPVTGKREVDRDSCQALATQAQAAQLACPAFIENEEDARKCELAVKLAVIATEFGCSFADDVDGSESEAQ